MISAILIALGALSRVLVRLGLPPLDRIAELFRIGAATRPEDHEKGDAPHRGEAARMGLLVEDLLTLARLDEMQCWRTSCATP